MQINASGLFASKPVTSDGQTARLLDILLDDRDWKVRYVVVALGKRLLGRPVLLPPEMLHACYASESKQLLISRDEIKKAPDLTLNPPVSWQRSSPSRLFRWRVKWGVAVPMPKNEIVSSDKQWAKACDIPEEQMHLRSLRELLGYSVIATDGLWGKLMDAIIDTDALAIIRLRVDSKQGLPVDITTGQVDTVDWAEAKITVSCRVQTIFAI